VRRREFLGFVGGAAAAWPLAARAQRSGPMRRVGVLMSTAETDPLETKSLSAFTEELARLGWTASQNVAIDVRWGAADAKRMTANARELVSFEPDVLLAKGATNPAARQATSTIPIVFVVLPEAAALAYVGDFRKPNSNSTGFTTYERDLVGKRLGLLRDLAPLTKRVLYVRSRQTGVDTHALFDRLTAEAGTVGLSVTDAPAENAAEIEAAFTAFTKEPNGGLIVAFDAFTNVHGQELIELAARNRLPAIYPASHFGPGGGLCSYGFNQDEQFREAASYVARILGGAKPADLPVQTPTKFELVLNLKTAKSLGLNVPPGIVAIADEVIE
jgi:putative tryptophan/tyrosine transport system substrate-binding protein